MIPKVNIAFTSGSPAVWRGCNRWSPNSMWESDFWVIVNFHEIFIQAEAHAPVPRSASTMLGRSHLPRAALFVVCVSHASAFISMPLATSQGAVRGGAAKVCMSMRDSSRREVILGGGLLAGAVLGWQPKGASALVKGLAPPADFGKRREVSGSPACLSI